MTATLDASRFMKAVRREPVDTTPVWLMRQAGRYLPEYMSVRSRVTFLELCTRPDLAAEVTLSAQAALGVDAAILFADLLPILRPMGLQLEYHSGEGPRIDNPLRTPGEVDRLIELEDMSEMEFVFETVRRVRADLPGDCPLIGFAGAPFTLASYAIEGGGSRNYEHTKRIMYDDPGAWQALMDRLVPTLSRYLTAQAEAGCQVVQIFDSWAGCLSPADYRRYVLPHSKRLIESLPDGLPVCHFLTGNPQLYPMQREAGGQVQGLDWRIGLAEGWELVGHDVAVQGNLDPVSLYSDLDVLRERTRDVLDAAAGRPGHIFNLGHGLLPTMDPGKVKALVEMVHEMGADGRSGGGGGVGGGVGDSE